MQHWRLFVTYPSGRRPEAPIARSIPSALTLSSPRGLRQETIGDLLRLWRPEHRIFRMHPAR
jgi:hypothetical protein